jgi:hypothetical protein
MPRQGHQQRRGPVVDRGAARQDALALRGRHRIAPEEVLLSGREGCLHELTRPGVDDRHRRDLGRHTAFAVALRAVLGIARIDEDLRREDTALRRRGLHHREALATHLGAEPPRDRLLTVGVADRAGHRGGERERLVSRFLRDEVRVDEHVELSLRLHRRNLDDAHLRADRVRDVRVLSVVVDDDAARLARQHGAALARERGRVEGVERAAPARGEQERRAVGGGGHRDRLGRGVDPAARRERAVCLSVKDRQLVAVAQRHEDPAIAQDHDLPRLGLQLGRRQLLAAVDVDDGERLVVLVGDEREGLACVRAFAERAQRDGRRLPRRADRLERARRGLTRAGGWLSDRLRRGRVPRRTDRATAGSGRQAQCHGRDQAGGDDEPLVHGAPSTQRDGRAFPAAFWLEPWMVGSSRA